MYPLENADLPAMCIYTQDEEIVVGAMGDPRVCHSSMTLIVDSSAQTSINLNEFGYYLDYHQYRFEAIQEIVEMTESFYLIYELNAGTF